MSSNAFVARTKFRLRNAISHLPSVCLPLLDLKRRDQDGMTIANAATDLVMEAYPRSGNTFAITALRHAQHERLRIAHHTHACANLLRAVQLRKPALLIVRAPKDAVLSLVIRHPHLTAEDGLRAWLKFHRPLLPHLDAFVVATFEQVTADFGVVVDRINRRFGTSFPRFEHTEANVQAVFAAIEQRNARLFGGGAVDERGVARPSESRGAIKAELQKEWSSPRLSRLREAAESMYADIRGRVTG